MTLANGIPAWWLTQTPLPWCQVVEHGGEVVMDAHPEPPDQQPDQIGEYVPMGASDAFFHSLRDAPPALGTPTPATAAKMTAPAIALSVLPFTQGVLVAIHVAGTGGSIHSPFVITIVLVGVAVSYLLARWDSSILSNRSFRGLPSPRWALVFGVGYLGWRARAISPTTLDGVRLTWLRITAFGVGIALIAFVQYGLLIDLVSA